MSRIRSSTGDFPAVTPPAREKPTAAPEKPVTSAPTVPLSNLVRTSTSEFSSAPARDPRKNPFLDEEISSPGTGSPTDAPKLRFNPSLGGHAPRKADPPPSPPRPSVSQSETPMPRRFDGAEDVPTRKLEPFQVQSLLRGMTKPEAPLRRPASTGTPSTGTPSTGTPSANTQSTNTQSTGTPSTSTQPTGARFTTRAAFASTQTVLKTRSAASTSSTSSTPPDTSIPADLLPITKDTAAGFRAAYTKALEEKEPWALALEAEAQGKFRALLAEAREEAGGPGASRPRHPDDPVTEDPRVTYMQEALATLEAEGVPWAHAHRAAGEAAAATARAEQTQHVVNTSFRTTRPDTLSPEEKKQVEKSETNPSVALPTSDDGSLKVPSPPEKHVLEYVRTNPVVEQLRRGAQAHIYNPVYSLHLGATVQAAGRDNGVPPQGKGFLAVTEHGFAYCYNKNLSPEQNRLAAEFSLKTGMRFEKCDGVDFKEALAKFDSFDPSQPGEVEVKIRLDRIDSGEDKVSLKSDGKGNVTSSFYFRPDRGEKFKDNLERYGAEVVALAANVIAPGSGFAIYASLAVSLKGTYQAVKNGDWLNAALGLASGFANLGAAGVFKEGGALAQAAATAGHVAQAIRGIQSTVQAVQTGSVGGALKGLGEVAGAIAGAAGNGAGGVSQAFGDLAKLAQKYGELAAFGEAAIKLIEKGDYAGAFLSAVQFAADKYPSTFKLDAETAARISKAAGALNTVNQAIRGKDYLGAVNALLSGVQGAFDPTKSNDVLAAGIALTGVLEKLKENDPLGAAKVAGEFAKRLWDARGATEQELKAPGTSEERKGVLRQVLADIDKQLQKFGGAEKLFDKVGKVLDAVKRRDVGALVEHASSVLGALTGNEAFGVAGKLAAASRDAIAAVKSGDYVKIQTAAAALREALISAGDLLERTAALPEGRPIDFSGAPGVAAPLPTTGNPADPFGLDPAKGPPPAGGPATTQYTVRAGDSLPRIAKELLGDEARWPELYFVNASTIGPNPSDLRAGQKLQLPDDFFSVPPEERQAIIDAAKTPPGGSTKPPSGGTTPSGGTPPTGGTTPIEGPPPAPDVLALLTKGKKVLDVLVDLAAELDHPELKALKGFLEQAVKTEAALRKEGKTTTDEYKAAVEQLKFYSAGINLADKMAGALEDIVAKGGQAFDQLDKDDLGKLKAFNAATKRLTSIVSLPQRVMDIMEKVSKVRGGIDLNGNAVSLFDQIKVAHELATDARAITSGVYQEYRGLQWAATVGSRALKGLGATALAKMTGKLAGYLKSLPEGLRGYIDDSVRPILNQLIGVGRADVAMRYVDDLGKMLVTKEFGEALAKRASTQVGKMLFSGLARLAGLPATIAIEVTLAEGKFVAKLAAGAYQDIANFLVRRAYGGDPQEILAQMDRRNVSSPESARNFLGDMFSDFPPDASYEVKKRFQAHLEKALASLGGVVGDARKTLLERLLQHPDLPLVAEAVKTAAHEFVPKDVQEQFFGKD
jgi:nucleoid-associated protein YgaU